MVTFSILCYNVNAIQNTKGDKMHSEILGKRIEKVRKKLKLSRKEVSSQINKYYRTYSGYERGERKAPYELLILLAEKYNVNLNWLMLGKGEMFNPPDYNEVKDILKSEVIDILKEQGLLKK